MRRHRSLPRFRARTHVWYSTSTLTAVRHRSNVFSREQARKPPLRFVPDLCQSIADLDDLADLVRRGNNKLRGISGRGSTDSVPGHHNFSNTYKEF